MSSAVRVVNLNPLASSRPYAYCPLPSRPSIKRAMQCPLPKAPLLQLPTVKHGSTNFAPSDVSHRHGVRLFRRCGRRSNHITEHVRTNYVAVSDGHRDDGCESSIFHPRPLPFLRPDWRFPLHSLERERGRKRDGGREREREKEREEGEREREGGRERGRDRGRPTTVAPLGRWSAYTPVV